MSGRERGERISTLTEQLDAVKAENDKLRAALRELYQMTGIIDNGSCAVCKSGYRVWRTPKCKEPAKPCSNEECLSRRIDAALEANAI